MTDQEIKETIEKAMRMAFIHDHEKDVFNHSRNYFECLDKLREKFAELNIKNYPEKDIETFSGQTWSTEYQALQAGIEFYGLIELEVGCNSASEYFVYPKDEK
jgi:hypothetical protein